MTAEEKAREYAESNSNLILNDEAHDQYYIDVKCAFLAGSRWQAEQDDWRPISKLNYSIPPHSYIIIKMANGSMMLRRIDNPTEVNKIKKQYHFGAYFKYIK